ncbi:MAG: 5'-methylthioadenosine/S-adenosylhomocysteine nucleosidase [Gammaproteobacteria bacterium]|nr:MAG: 5'-methylthioadenosine/S-adenosylhomocysteine nucleosidase [Gammaproteobacteria bacterium]
MAKKHSPNKNGPIAIIGAMPQEITTLSEHMTQTETLTTAGMTLYNGFINNVSVVVMQCGIGKVNATIGTTLLIERFAPRAVVNTGSAGGIGTNLHVGDIVIGQSLAHHDVDITTFGYAMGQMAQMPIEYPCDQSLIKAARQATETFSDIVIHYGQIVSGDQFIADNEHFTAIRKNFPNALAVEMEAAAIAQTCYRFDIPFVVIRAISDLANETAAISFDQFIIEAGKRSAEMVISFLKNYH